jgi:ferric-dicitrate binding protein FerR (iron transport regulator)
METERKQGPSNEWADILKTHALFGWVKRENDTLDAVESWLRFKQSHERKGPALLLRVFSYAAAVAAAIIVTFFISKPIAYNNLLADSGVQTITAPAGQRAKIDMPDGSTVWLNANSTLTYPTVFRGKERHVSLNGEAYFEVAHNSECPFFVESDKAIVKVLGTHFCVTDFKDTDEYSSSLLEGKVSVQFKGMNMQPILLSPNQTVRKTGNTVSRTSFYNDDFLLWRRGIFAFDDCTFEEVLSKLERYYDVKIIIKNNSIKKYRISGKCRQNDGIESFLKTLQKLHRFKYIKDDETNTIIIDNH